MEFDTPKPVTLDHLDLQVVADGRHSVPTQLRIDSGAESRTIDLPAITASKQENATVSVPVSFAPMTVSSARITITQVQAKLTKDYYCECKLAMPAAIAEFGIPGVQRAPLPAQLPTACRTDLLQVDDQALGVRMTGSAADAESGQAIDLQLCDPQDASATPTVALTAGDHVVRSQPGKVTGIDFDRFLLGSDAAGSAMTLGARGSLTDSLQATGSAPAATTPTVRVTHNGATNIKLQVSGAQPGTPFWLVLGESQNDGWEATVAGTSHGSSSLVDGFANGWLVNPSSTSFSVTLDWTPQRQVWIAIAISAGAILLCLFLALRGLRKRRRTARAVGAASAVDVERDGDVSIGNPLLAEGARPSRAVVVAAPIIAALVGAFVASAWVGLLAGAGVLAVLLRPRLRGVLALGAPLALGAVALFVAVQQYRYDYLPTYFWPEYFDRVNDLAWLAVILLASDAFVELLRTRPWRRTRDVQEPASSP